jgi:thiosulfate reductase cytochrome b subunit
MHWINALAMIALIGSGWKIYDDQPLFAAISFPGDYTLGGFPETAYKLHGDAGFGGALLWHFAAMWVLVVNFAIYLGYGLISGRFRRMLLPISVGETLRTVRDALRFHLAHDDLTMYNAVQKLLYIGVILLIVIQVLAGLALWKPVQFSGLATLFGGFNGARLVHFLGMMGICLFLCVHVALALLVPRTLLAMVTGGPKVSARRRHAPLPYRRRA